MTIEERAAQAAEWKAAGRCAPARSAAAMRSWPWAKYWANKVEK